MARISLKTKLLGGIFMAVLIFAAVWAVTTKKIMIAADVYPGQIYGKINSLFSACPPRNFNIRAEDISVKPPAVRYATPNASGDYKFTNLPLDTYHMVAEAWCPSVTVDSYQLPSGFCIANGGLVSLTQSQPTFRQDLTADKITGLVRVHVVEVYDIPGAVRKSHPLSGVKVSITNGSQGITDEDGNENLYAESGTQQVSAEYQSKSYVKDVKVVGCGKTGVVIGIHD